MVTYEKNNSTLYNIEFKFKWIDTENHFSLKSFRRNITKDFDSTILYSYSNRSYRPNYLIIAKKDSLVFLPLFFNG